MHKLLSKIWRFLSSNYKWHILWIIHSKFMIGVSAVILNENKKILLLKHRYWKNNSWGLPSGYVQKGETLEEAIQREIKEETNLTITVKKLINLKSGFKLRIECSFIGHCSDSSNMILNSDEVLEADFFAIEHLPMGLLSSHKELIDNVFNNSNTHGDIIR